MEIRDVGAYIGAVLLIGFMVIWSIAGILAFVMSLFCFAYKSSITEKLLGLVFSIFLGPLYWIYYYYNKSYCNK